MPKEIFNIVFNSDLASGTTVNDNFFFDWSRLPDVPYHVSFTFFSAVAVTTYTSVANVFIDLGCSHTFIASSPSGYSASSPMYLGSLNVSNLSTSFLACSENDNTPIYLRGRPTNNNVLIQIHRNINNQTTDYVSPPGRYTLCLCLRALDEISIT